MKIKKILLSLLFALSLLLIACGENDAITISLSGDDSVKVNDEVVLLKDIEHIEYVADYLETIPYEVLCLVSKRVPRIYVS